MEEATNNNSIELQQKHLTNQDKIFKQKSVIKEIEKHREIPEEVLKLFRGEK